MDMSWKSLLGGAVAVLLAVPTAGDAAPDTQWPSYGNDPGGRRYADVDQITADNVAELDIAWTYRSGDLGAGFASGERMAFEATPILLDGTLYLSTPYGQVHAVDAVTGRQVWRFDAELANDQHYSENTSRGVSAWRNPDAAAGEPCALRIFVGTLDARLIALDAATGTPCPDFGAPSRSSNPARSSERAMAPGTVDLNENSTGSTAASAPPATPASSGAAGRWWYSSTRTTCC
jgi:quinoprotein glucose dehydrogenase